VSDVAVSVRGEESEIIDAYASELARDVVLNLNVAFLIKRGKPIDRKSKTLNKSKRRRERIKVIYARK
jgi:hypothetical protein